MRWSEVASEMPVLGEAAEQRMAALGLVLLGTVRADGTPRISPVEPLFWNGDLWLGLMWGSAKAADLVRDPRLLVHSVISRRDGDEGELKLRGLAEPVNDDTAEAGYAEAFAARTGLRPDPGRFHLFRADIEAAHLLWYDQGDQHVIAWPPPRAFVRRVTSVTTVGDPEPLPVPRTLSIPSVRGS